MEPDGTAQVAVFVDFENLVLGAVKELPGQANPAPYEAIDRLSRVYGTASVRRAYANWADPRFGGHQEDLAMNGVDLIQVARVGIQNKNAADIRMAVDAMETLIVHPAVSVFILVSGDGDYSPLVQRLREFGKWVVGVGTEANASRKLVSVTSEYKYWGTLVAEVEPEARPTAAFDIGEAEQVLVRAFEESNSETMTAGGLKSKMLALDPAFDEHNYGARSFRAFLALLPKRVQIVETSGPDIIVKLIEAPAAKPARTRTRKSLERGTTPGPGDASIHWGESAMLPGEEGLMISVPSKYDSCARSRRHRPARPWAAAVGLSAAALVLVAACSSGGTSAGGSGSASTPLTPQQALLAAATSASQGMYDHGVIGSKGNFVFVIDDATGTAAPVPLVETMAHQEYAAL